MQRRPWFELHDHPRFPGFLRDLITEGLEFIWNRLGSYRAIEGRLQRAVALSRAPQIVDLCSGGGGPWLSLAPGLRHGDGSPAQVVLTDRFPNLAAFARTRQLSAGRIQYAPEPVDARQVPETLPGFRTIFSSFHHFSPAQAGEILADAFHRREGIAVFELARPQLRTVLLCFTMPLLSWILTPRMRPLGWRRMVWTYLLPIIPAVLYLDGVLSCLRSYSLADLRELVAPLASPDYGWEVGEAGNGKAKVAYLIGIPLNRRASGT
jgi:hypothetical protein